MKKAFFHHIFNILPHWKEYYKCAKYEAIKIGQNPLFTDIYAQKKCSYGALHLEQNKVKIAIFNAK